MASLNTIMARLANNTNPWQDVITELGMTQINSNMWVVENDWCKLQLMRSGGAYRLHYRSQKQRIMVNPITIEQLKQIMEIAL